MKKSLVYLFISLIFFSCKKPDEVFSTSVSIILLDQQGQNLLSSTSNLKENDIEVFVVKNGETKPFNKPTIGNPKGFTFGITNSQKTLVLLTYDEFGKGVDFSTSIFKLGSYGSDTVKCQFVKGGNRTRVSKVWYNGDLKFDESVDKFAPLVTVIK